MVTHHVAAGAAQTLPIRTSTELRVLHGMLWLTQSGDPDDHHVRAGQSFALTGARAVVQAEGGRPASYLLRKN